jgi:NitT/TauT family transport system permease protein
VPAQARKPAPLWQRYPRLWSPGLPILIVVTFLLTWEWAAQNGVITTLFFPAPTTIARTFWREVTNGRLPTNLSLTISRLVVGMLVGGTPGLLLGLFMGWYPPLRRVLDPLIAAVHPMPKISLLPLILIIFGLGETSKIVSVAIGTFFPMLLNSMAGVRQISPLYFEVAQNFRADRWTILRRIVLPGSLPFVLTGARLALNTALLLTIAVELVSAQKGLGAAIWLAWETLRTEELFANLVVIASLGATFNFLLQRLAQRLVPWQTERPR